MSLVGERIDALCLKCKLALAHVVMYEKKGKPGRVKCLTCGGEHMYRGPIRVSANVKSTAATHGKAPGRSKPGTQQLRAVREAGLRWVMQKQNMKAGQPIREYHLNECFERGDVIDHPQFGLGFVEMIVADQRMEVLFREGKKTLGMNYAL